MRSTAAFFARGSKCGSCSKTGNSIDNAMSESLRQLLRTADRMPSLSDASELAASVRRRRIDQRRRRRIMFSAAVIVLVISVTLVAWPKRVNRDVVNVAPVPPSGPSLASLQIDARVHALTAEALLSSERARHAQRYADAQPDP